MIDLQRHIDMQRAFEADRQGIDGTLFDFNTVDFCLVRGVVGEALEAYTAWRMENQESLEEELADVYIFFASTLMHAGIDAERLSELVDAKLQRNVDKYDPSLFEGVTVAQGIANVRENYKHKHLGTKVE
jgi:NTP pyrophosphatase (non-canonical NTP hydrolase)